MIAIIHIQRKEAEDRFDDRNVENLAPKNGLIMLDSRSIDGISFSWKCGLPKFLHKLADGRKCI